MGRTILDTPSEAFSRVLGVNTLANVYAAKLFLPHMLATNHGHIVTVASGAAYVSDTCSVVGDPTMLSPHDVVLHIDGGS